MQKNLSSPLHRNGNLVHVVPWFLTCSLGLLALGTDPKSRKGLYSGPSPIQNAFRSRHSMFWNDTCSFSFFLSSEYSLHTHWVSQEKQKENYFCCGAILQVKWCSEQGILEISAPQLCLGEHFLGGSALLKGLCTTHNQMVLQCKDLLQFFFFFCDIIPRKREKSARHF